MFDFKKAEAEKQAEEKDIISEREFMDWLENPITQYLKKYITNKRDLILRVHLRGEPVDDGCSPILIEGVRNGYINAYNDILGINYNLAETYAQMELSEKNRQLRAEDA